MTSLLFFIDIISETQYHKSFQSQAISGHLSIDQCQGHNNVKVDRSQCKDHTQRVKVDGAPIRGDLDKHLLTYLLKG